MPTNASSSKASLARRLDKFVSARDRARTTCSVCLALAPDELQVIQEARDRYKNRLKTEGGSNKHGANNKVILDFLHEDLKHPQITMNGLRWHFTAEHVKRRESKCVLKLNKQKKKSSSKR